MNWALVNPHQKSNIFKQAKTKYDLLKWGVTLKEPISKKSVTKLKEGDLVTVIFTNRFKKWFTDPRTGRHYQDYVVEQNEKKYLLVQLMPSSEGSKWKEQAEILKKEKKGLETQLQAHTEVLNKLIEQTNGIEDNAIQETIKEAILLLAGDTDAK